MVTVSIDIYKISNANKNIIIDGLNIVIKSAPLYLIQNLVSELLSLQKANNIG